VPKIPSEALGTNASVMRERKGFGLHRSGNAAFFTRREDGAAMGPVSLGASTTHGV
jgi:hypothetical protein